MLKPVKSTINRWLSRFASRRDLDNLYLQIASLLEVKGLVGDATPLGPLRGWAISPDALLLVLRDIVARREPRVVEFGAGESTIAIASALRRIGGGRLVTFEHDPAYAARTDGRLDAAGLSAYVDVRTPPLRSYAGRGGRPGFTSYDLNGEDLAFDVALIDGPVAGAHGPETRTVPLEWCVERLRGNASVYLDDADRPGEGRILDHLRRRRPELVIEAMMAEKGLARLGARPAVRLSA